MPSVRSAGLVVVAGAALAACLAVAALGRAPSGCARADGGARLGVPKGLVSVDDGDSLVIRWKEGVEVVRILGIDAPETLHLEHDIPYPQPFGEAAAGFLAGAVAAATRVEIVRAAKPDAYGRTLAWVFLDGRSVSVLEIEARLAVETVSRFGDNGFPQEAQACLAAAQAAGPVAFEEPHLYRRRMRTVSAWLKERGLYPRGPPEAAK